MRANAGFFDTSVERFRAGLVVGKLLKRMVSAEGIEPSTYCSTVHELKSMVSATFRQLD